MTEEPDLPSGARNSDDETEALMAMGRASRARMRPAVTEQPTDAMNHLKLAIEFLEGNPQNLTFGINEIRLGISALEAAKPSTPAIDDEGLVEKASKAMCRAHDDEQDRIGKKGYALSSYNAGASVDYWNTLARAALKAIQG